MSNKLKIKNKINIDNVEKRIINYPYINNLLKDHIASLSKINPPFIDQVHIFIEWLNRYQDTSIMLLEEMERMLDRVSKSNVKNIEILFKRLKNTIDKDQFKSVDSELFLLNYFILNGTIIDEYEPLTTDNNNHADYKLIFGDDDVIIELITPRYPRADFEDKKELLFEKIEQVDSELLIEISGFELFDFNYHIEGKSPEIVEPPNNNQIQETINNFRIKASTINEDELPLELINLCSSYPRIKIKILRKLTKEEIKLLSEPIGTFVISHSSRSGEGIPVGRFVKLIKNEKKHFASDNINFLFIDLSYWSVVDRHYLDSEIYRKMFIDEINRQISSKVNGLFTYIVSNKKDEQLVNRRVLYVDDNIEKLKNKDLIEFINLWTN